MATIEYISISEFRELGYLQELNRQFLHPLGLALSVRIEDDGTEVLNGIWDCRCDPEGIRFVELDAEDSGRAQRIMQEQEKRAKARQEVLGYVIQPYETRGVKC